VYAFWSFVDTNKIKNIEVQIVITLCKRIKDHQKQETKEQYSNTMEGLSN
jgi:hypothetical protein